MGIELMMHTGIEGTADRGIERMVIPVNVMSIQLVKDKVNVIIL